MCAGSQPSIRRRNVRVDVAAERGPWVEQHEGGRVSRFHITREDMIIESIGVEISVLQENGKEAIVLAWYHGVFNISNVVEICKNDLE